LTNGEQYGKHNTTQHNTTQHNTTQHNTTLSILYKGGDDDEKKDRRRNETNPLSLMEIR
jgi:hypothetical protein